MKTNKFLLKLITFHQLENKYYNSHAQDYIIVLNVMGLL
jgi:hypothetical protein